MKKATTPEPAEQVSPQSPQCVDCRTIAPPTGTNYTLISSKFGWRLTRAARAPGGPKGMEWRCPACYARRRAQDRR